MADNHGAGPFKTYVQDNSNLHYVRVLRRLDLQILRSPRGNLSEGEAMNSAILAIDPGKSGGIAFQISAHNCPVAESMPETEADVVEALRTAAGTAYLEGVPLVAYVEKVGGFVGKGQPGSAMFKFGFGAGVIEGALRALGIRTIYVRPQEWQKHFSLGTAAACASKTKWKGKLKAEAQRRYPDLKVTLATADALLILDYAKAQP